MAKGTGSKTGTEHYDVVIVGGGINGAGIAREASAAGYSVCVCDAGDFGGGTSSASTKLIHGGLRYLEHYEFRLVREALLEREVLWKMAPHIIKPMRFVLPHHSGLRPKWLLRLGLFLYDHIGGRKLLAPAKSLDLHDDEAGKPLKPEFRHGFEYSDCWVEDSRLVILNLRDAEALGASIRPRTRVEKASFDGDIWSLELSNTDAKDRATVTASMVINAAGPWVDEVLRQVFGLNSVRNVRLVKGSHIVVPKMFEHDRAYIFQNADERVIFAIPYEQDFTLIGTTDVEQESLAEKIAISDSEIEYLCNSASEYFENPVTPDQVVWTYSGVRPLFDDGASKAQEATRDYIIKSEASIGNGSLINIFGGKITTFRKLAHQLVSEIEDVLGARQVKGPPPDHYRGGDFEITEFEELVDSLADRYPFVDRRMLNRLAKLYGTDAGDALNNAQSMKDLGKCFGQDLYEAEVLYLMENEWVRSADDLLFRRTKLGIRLTAAEKTTLDKWIKTNGPLAKSA